jgi:pimeloyl-ACP methyl ester carboxylesterase
VLLRAAVCFVAALGAAGAVTASAQETAYPDPMGYCVEGNVQYDPVDTERPGAVDPELPPGYTRTRAEPVEGFGTYLIEGGPRQLSEAVVFVHGNPGSALDFAGIMRAVPAGVRVVAFDLVGFGDADKPFDFPYTVDVSIPAFALALRRLGVERVHLVGHDIGGFLGVEWASRNPRAFRSAVLMNTGVLLTYEDHDFARIWKTPVEGEASMAAVTREFFVSSIQQAEPRPLPREFLDRNYDDFDRATRCAILKSYRSVPDVRPLARAQADRLRPYDRPALVIWGDEDSFLPTKHAHEQREAFPRASIHVIPQGGHWPFVHEEERVVSLIRPFLERQVRQRAGAPLRLAVRPRRARPGHRTRFRVRVRLGAPVQGAVVRMGRRRARTNTRGRAVIALSPRRPGRVRVRASKAPFSPGRGFVRVLRR